MPAGRAGSRTADARNCGPPGQPGGPVSRSDGQGVRPARASDAPPEPGVSERRVDGAGGGVQLWRHVDGHRPYQPSPGKSGSRSWLTSLREDGPGRGVPVRSMTGRHLSAAVRARWPIGIFLTGGLVATVVSFGAGIDARDTAQVMVESVVGAAAAGLLAAALLSLLRGTRLAVQATVAALAPVAALAIGVS